MRTQPSQKHLQFGVQVFTEYVCQFVGNEHIVTLLALEMKQHEKSITDTVPWNLNHSKKRFCSCFKKTKIISFLFNAVLGCSLSLPYRRIFIIILLEIFFYYCEWESRFFDWSKVKPKKAAVITPKSVRTVVLFSGLKYFQTFSKFKKTFAAETNWM